MVTDGIFQPHKRAVVKERWRHRKIPKGRGSELVPIGFIAGDLFQPEIFVFVGTIKDDVAEARSERWRDLWNAGDVFLEVAEHFVRSSRDRVAAHTPGFAEKEKRTALFGRSHRLTSPSRELIGGRICKHQPELQFGYRFSHHDEIDLRASPPLPEYLSHYIPLP